MRSDVGAREPGGQTPGPEEPAPADAAGARDGGPDLAVRLAARVVPQRVAWLWPGNFALGKVAVVAGAAGGGKTLLAAGDFAARVSNGADWPDGSPCPRGEVLIVSGEDSPADTLVPRLVDHGADLNRVRFVEGLGEGGEGPAGPACANRAFTLRDLPALERELRRHGPTRLVVIDPVSAFMGDTDGNNNVRVRGLLAPLQALADRLAAAFVLVTHLRKKQAAGAAHAVIGSVALVAAARTAWLLTRDAGDRDRRLFTVVKNNLGQDRFGYAWRLVDGKVTWEPERLDLSGDDALAGGAAPSQPARPREALAEAFVADFLKDGPRAWEAVAKAGKKAGHSDATLRRARDGVAETYKIGGRKGRWLWRLAGDTRTKPLENPLDALEWDFEHMFEPE